MRNLLSLVLLAAASLANAAGTNVVPGVRCQKPPVLDGVIHEGEEWANEAQFREMVDSDTGTPAPEGGTFWLTYDANFVYFAARLADREPSKIQASEYRTNVGLRGNDTVTVLIDPFGTRTDFNQFSMNANGATNVQIAGGRAAKREWLGDFQSKGRITENGWEVEAKIPWNIMRLPGKGARELRFNVLREFRRYQRFYGWRYTGGGQIDNFGRWTNVEIPAQSAKTIKLLPYVYAGYSEDEHGIANAGADVRTSLSDTLDLVGTVNPDFRNVENQVLSLDFSYFERLAAESRPFFLEGQQFFNTTMDAPLFASQRIEGFDGGLKTFGKLDDKTDIGLLDTLDFNHQNAFVARIKRQLAPKSSITVATTDLSQPGYHNAVNHLQFDHGFGPFSVFANVQQSQDSNEGTGGRSNLGLFYGKDGAFAVLDYYNVSNRYLPALGFSPEVGFSGLSMFGRVRRPLRSHGLTEFELGVNGADYRTLDGNPYRSSAGFFSRLTWANGFAARLGVDDGSFEGNRDFLVNAGIEKPRRDPYRHWEFNAAYGRQGGEPYYSAGPAISYRPRNAIQLSGSFQQVSILGDVFYQGILGATWDLGKDMSVSGRLVQQNSGSNSYLAFRRSGNRGAEIFVILGDPNATRFKSSLIVKVSMPFEIK